MTFICHEKPNSAYLIIIVHVVESHECFVVGRDLQYVLEGVVSDDLALVECQTRPVNA